MKYLIDYRYKVVHSIKVTVSSILSICEKGHSKEFGTKFDLLNKLIPDLSPMMTPPFNEKMIDQLKKLQAELEEFILLPDDLEKRGHKLVQATKSLLSFIDPFHFSAEETPHVRRSQIVEITQNLQIYLQRQILALQGKATSLIDEKSIIQEFLTELFLISIDPFSETEKKAIEDLFSSRIAYEIETSLAHTQQLLNQAILVESTFKTQKPKKKSS
ncbi:MAG: hypothetical protein FJZ63_06740 [Chlamydiae bacterium]|nr:hypothetical protein [Chlamydiota bacterium]